MRIYRKEGDVIQLISFPSEDVEKGDYLLIEEPHRNRALLVQAVDIQFANVPGILEELLRDVMSDGLMVMEDVDPYGISSQVDVLKDARLIVCKIRGALEDGMLSRNVAWLPSRTGSRIAPFGVERLLGVGSTLRQVVIGHTRTGSELAIAAESLDGRLNVITGRKGTGKSHLAKLLVLALIDSKAPCIVLDVNGEYVGLGTRKDGVRSKYHDKVIVMKPGVNLQFALSEVRLGTFLGLMVYALDLPTNSARVLASMWSELERRGNLTLRGLGEAIARWDCHESVRDALQSRYYTISESGLFTDIGKPSVMERIADLMREGGALVIDMKNQSSIVRRITVELVISKLVELLSSRKVRALFLLAEEAHLYLRETYWDDIVTRMRHLGLFVTFITNQPDTIQESVYRQADNIFLFNFTNERDLDFVSRAAKVDAETVRSLVRDLPPHWCLIVGEAVQDFPMIIRVKDLDVETLGETRYFFAHNVLAR